MQDMNIWLCKNTFKTQNILLWRESSKNKNKSFFWRYFKEPWKPKKKKKKNALYEKPWDISQNLFFCVPQNKYSFGTSFHSGDPYPFNGIRHITHTSISTTSITASIQKLGLLCHGEVIKIGQN